MNEQQGESGLTTQAVTGTAVDSGVNEGAPVGFFAIGIVINLVLLGAYLAWAWRRWKRPDSEDRSS